MLVSDVPQSFSILEQVISGESVEFILAADLKEDLGSLLSGIRLERSIV